MKTAPNRQLRQTAMKTASNRQLKQTAMKNSLPTHRERNTHSLPLAFSQRCLRLNLLLPSAKADGNEEQPPNASGAQHPFIAVGFSQRCLRLNALLPSAKADGHENSLEPSAKADGNEEQPPDASGAQHPFIAVGF